MPQITYSIKKNRLAKSVIQGMEMGEDGRTLFLREQPARRLYLPMIDSAQQGSTWGRLSFESEITDEMVLYVYILATDIDTIYDENGTVRIEDILLGNSTVEEKKKIFLDAGAKRYVGKRDILLYEFTGRYLFLAIEVYGDGEGVLTNLKVEMRGDQFMDTFPAVYRERNSFFHRFLSIFSSIYNDFDRQIEELPTLLNADTAPVEMLPIYAGWLGIDLSGEFLSEEAMRTFVKEGFNLNRMKGTKACLERVIEIVLGERVIILEQNAIKSYLEKGDVVDVSLEHTSIYDVNILIRQELSETDRHQLLYLLRQFTPIRSKIHLIHLKDSGVLDTDIYLDLNAVLTEETYGVLDESMEMDDEIVLE